MRLSADLIAEFQKRYLTTFGERISPETAESELLSLAELIRITQKPIEEDYYGTQPTSQDNSR